jgi:hypothetical protein
MGKATDSLPMGEMGPFGQRVWRVPPEPGHRELQKWGGLGDWGTHGATNEGCCGWNSPTWMAGMEAHPFSIWLR